jgi:hypothetical protein
MCQGWHATRLCVVFQSPTFLRLDFCRCLRSFGPSLLAEVRSTPRLYVYLLHAKSSCLVHLELVQVSTILSSFLAYLLTNLSVVP